MLGQVSYSYYLMGRISECRERAWPQTNLASVVEKVVFGAQTLFSEGERRRPGIRYVCGPQAVQKVYSAIHGINFDPLDNAVGKPNTYPVDSAIQRLNNRGLKDRNWKDSVLRKRDQ